MRLKRNLILIAYRSLLNRTSRTPMVRSEDTMYSVYAWTTLLPTRPKIVRMRDTVLYERHLLTWWEEVVEGRRSNNRTAASLTASECSAAESSSSSHHRNGRPSSSRIYTRKTTDICTKTNHTHIPHFIFTHGLRCWNRSGLPASGVNSKRCNKRLDFCFLGLIIESPSSRTDSNLILFLIIIYHAQKRRVRSFQEAIVRTSTTAVDHRRWTGFQKLTYLTWLLDRPTSIGLVQNVFGDISTEYRSWKDSSTLSI